MVVDPNYLNLMRNILITLIFFFFLTQNVQAEQRDDELNSLFEKLKISNQSEVKEIENKIWKIWTTHPSTDRRGYRLTELLAHGLTIQLIYILVYQWTDVWSKFSKFYSLFLLLQIDC